MKNGLVILMLLISASIKAQEIGIQFYSLRAQFPKDVAGTMAEIKNWGVREAEIGGTYGLSTDDFKKLLKKNKIRVIATSADFDKLINDPQGAIAEAKLYGAKYIVCHWIKHNGNDFTIEDAKNAVAVFNKAGKLMKEKGISLCYHPHGFEFRPYGNGTLFDYLITNLNAHYVNFEMDVFWVKHPGQDPVALLKKYPNRFVLMHLKDRQPGTPGNQNGQADVETNVTLGTGDVGIAEIMKTAKVTGVKHYFIEDESSRSEKQIPESLAYLRSLR